MLTHDLHCIGASAGGVEALQQLLAGLPRDLPATVCIVLHTAPASLGMLPSVLQRACVLPVVSPQDRQPFARGCVYVAPPDQHLLVMGDRIRVVRGPKENRHRPAIDPLFRSAAWSFGPRVVGIVLTGMLDDGTAGLWAIKMCGGVSVVQDPAEALYAEMPLNAIRNVEIDHRLPVNQIAPLLTELAHRPIRPLPPPDRADRLRVESEFAMLDRESRDMNLLEGKPTTFTCPSCHGSLWELTEGGLLRFRCHTGHAFGTESLQAAQADALEEALYAALRALEEKAFVSRRLAEHDRDKHPDASAQLVREATQLEERAGLIRQLVSQPLPQPEKG